MNKEFITYEQALALKELGFDESCLGHYDNPENSVWITDSPPYYAIKENVCLAPLYQQAFRWFREKYKIVAAITVRNDDFDFTIFIPWNIECYENNTEYNTYEKAEQACLNNLIEIIKNK
jgi:hypothetical protein